MLSCSVLWSSETHNNIDKKIDEVFEKIQCAKKKLASIRWSETTHLLTKKKLEEEYEQLIKEKNAREQAKKEEALLEVNPLNNLYPSTLNDPNLYRANKVLTGYLGTNSEMPLMSSQERAILNPLDSKALVPYNNGFSAPIISPSGLAEKYKIPTSIYTNISRKSRGVPSNLQDLPMVPSNVYRHEESRFSQKTVAKPNVLALENGQSESLNLYQDVLTKSIAVTEEDIRTTLLGKNSYRFNQSTIYCFVYNDELISLVPTRDPRGQHTGFIQKRVGSLVPSKSKPSKLHFKMNNNIEIIVHPLRVKDSRMQMSFLDLYKVGLNLFNSDCCPGEQFKFQFLKREDLLSR
ncbi:MAG: hypothetical protein C0432_00585 [Candidatus Puniceispirillum sp.]|nr:hypothetical protein [Candidatus Pelagibacter sp.]MBA4282779.1 hypothetical protein [Candidatus Puniceispirillum sp.]